MKKKFLSWLLFFLMIEAFSFAQLSGNYIIGGMSSDYPNVQNAIADLQLQGINGPVTFKIRPGNYTEILKIQNFNYLFPVKFIGESTNQNDAVISLSYMYSCSGITFKHLLINPYTDI